jgi:hypothetical protein
MILTESEVMLAIDADEDFDRNVIKQLAIVATSYLKVKTGYDFSKDRPRHPLAVECARQYVRHIHYNANQERKGHDYTLGIEGLIEDLQVIAYELKKKAQTD